MVIDKTYYAKPVANLGIITRQNIEEIGVLVHPDGPIDRRRIQIPFQVDRRIKIELAIKLPGTVFRRIDHPKVLGIQRDIKAETVIVLRKNVTVEDQLISCRIPERKFTEVEAVFVECDPVLRYIERLAGNRRRVHGA